MSASKKKATKRKEENNKQKEPRANWGADENPRHCRKCHSKSSRVVDTKRMKIPERKIRYRICNNCGQRFSTIEVM